LGNTQATNITKKVETGNKQRKNILRKVNKGSHL